MNWKRWKHNRIVNKVKESLKTLVYDDNVPLEEIKSNLEELKYEVAFYVHFVAENIIASKEKNNGKH